MPKTYNNFKLTHLTTIDSTNSYLVKQAQQNLANEFEVVIADEQTNGYGRKNREWQSLTNNLHFSFIVKPKVAIEDISQISLICTIALGLATDRLLEQASNDAKTSYKWPNDLLINNKKISGILLESQISHNVYDFVVVGIGYNIAQSPESTIFPADNLRNYGVNINKIDFLELFLEEFWQIYHSWLQFGFNNLRLLWLKKAFKLEQEITLNIDDENISGVFTDIDSKGNMILEINGEHKIINFAEIL